MSQKHDKQSICSNDLELINLDFQNKNMKTKTAGNSAIQTMFNTPRMASVRGSQKNLL